jgi:hypothetical protein
MEPDVNQEKGNRAMTRTFTEAEVERALKEAWIEGWHARRDATFAALARTAAVDAVARILSGMEAVEPAGDGAELVKRLDALWAQTTPGEWTHNGEHTGCVYGPEPEPGREWIFDCPTTFSADGEWAVAAHNTWPTIRALALPATREVPGEATERSEERQLGREEVFDGLVEDAERCYPKGTRVLVLDGSAWVPGEVEFICGSRMSDGRRHGGHAGHVSVYLDRGGRRVIGPHSITRAAPSASHGTGGGSAKESGDCPACCLPGDNCGVCGVDCDGHPLDDRARISLLSAEVVSTRQERAASSPTPTPMRVAEAVRDAAKAALDLRAVSYVAGGRGDEQAMRYGRCVDACADVIKKLGLPAILSQLGSPADGGASEAAKALEDAADAWERDDRTAATPQVWMALWLRARRDFRKLKAALDEYVAEAGNPARGK